MSIHNSYTGQMIDGQWVSEIVPESYQGCVLSEGEHNYHDDSDGYALVWDEQKGIIEVGTWTTRGASQTYARVDATEEVKDKARAWKDE